jgi:hypothetical protein
MGLVLYFVLPCAAQQYTQFSRFDEMTPGELVTLQLKLSYLGIQYKPLQSIVIVTGGQNNKVDLDLFVPFRRTGYEYLNDDDPVVLEVTPDQFSALIDSVKSLPGVTDGGADSGGWDSFMLVNALEDSLFGFEAIVGGIDGSALLVRMRTAFHEAKGVTRVRGDLRAEEDVVRRINSWACPRLFPQNIRTEVTGAVAIKLLGIGSDQLSNAFVARLRVQNISNDQIAAPLAVVLYEAAGVQILNSDGTVCLTHAGGWDYFEMPLSGPLKPGQAIERAVRFANTEQFPIEIAPRAYAGPGEL